MELIEILKVVILGIIQGITEWLPISSTGHMILADTFLQLQQPKDFMDMFYVVIQLGSILAVVVLYFNKLNPFSRAKSRAERLSTFQLWFKVIVAILPIGVIGLLVDDWVTEHFYTPTVIAIALIFYGVLFILLEKRNHRVKPRIRNFEQLSYRTAVCIGILQLLAIIPGTSRSGSTILGAMLLSCSRFVATEFSFFMAIPVMFGASGYKILKFILKTGLASITGFQWGLLLIGSLVAFVVSLFAIKFLMNFIRKHDFTAFGWYRIVLGIIVILFFGAKAIFA
ncbi:MAG: undecaprenyl-diphosphate phosphatase [Negativibacillus massiliensis]|uniref:undecaprenyl-diphosphate phosphatase n=2 Tax=Negativibacillus massiliensis TaxID=1871035 RepID=UPI00034047C5|nr:undecaprenyl-diphosphate phosphatase [Negativibacillus massiliensis]MCI6347581.1 undecaprenyl-diphosphate phosphatase [Negativibacillus massiliensis]MDY4048220.1 undecaprenyl-diphosphate phosphatase [Negativibacillus massiliensis]CDA79577.1 undecaprenyl-diphosphatase 1 [Clostridium sp. CAG:242]